MRIGQERRRAGLTQEELCVMVPGIESPSLLSKMETGKCNPTALTFREIARALDVSFEALASPYEVDYGLKAARRPGDRHKGKKRISFRPEHPDEFFRALAVLDLTPTQWLRKQEKALLRLAKRKAPASAATEDKGVKKNNHNHDSAKEGVCQ